MNLKRNVIREKSPVLEVVTKVKDITNKNIGEAVDSFLNEKKKHNINTYRNYKVDIEHFFKVHFGKSYKDVTFNELNSKSDIDSMMEYFNFLFELTNTIGERALSNSTINRKQVSVKQLMKWFKMKRVLIEDITDLSYIKQLPKETNNIEMIPFDVALSYAQWFKDNEKDRPLEKYLITRLAIDTGLRAIELVKLKWSQFTVDNNVVIMRGVGKGNKKWIEKISLEFYHELEQLKSNKNNDNLFTIKYHTIPSMMNRAKKSFGHEGKNYSFHSFKKTSVNMAYRLTGDILEAQRKGRHSSLDTTRIYTEAEDYGITGLISLGDDIPIDLYKTVDKDLLLEALEKMNSDFLYILNSKIQEMGKK